MNEKREARRHRAEAEREHREHQKRQQRLKARLILVAGVLVVIALGFMATRRDGDESGGRVWSAEHGHWHDR
jgi:hypothetical protein